MSPLVIAAIAAAVLLLMPRGATANYQPSDGGNAVDVNAPGYRPAVAGDDALSGILGALGAAIGGLLGTAIEPGGGSAVGGAVGGAAGTVAGQVVPQGVSALSDPYTWEQSEQGWQHMATGDVAGAYEEHFVPNLLNFLGVDQ